IELSRQIRYVLRSSALAGAVAVVGCAASGPSTRAAFATPRAGTPSTRVATQPTPGWRLATMEHVDLWLHGYAMLTSDTGHVPFFDRGYKREITALKRQKNIYTNLDANQSTLSQRFAANPALANGQFLAMYFTSFQEIVNATDAFFRAQGDPRATRDPQLAQRI